MKTAEIYTHTHTHTHTNKLLLCGFLTAVITISPTFANDELDNALRATYTACVGIDDELHDLKVMAGINTAVTSVGTATGIGATTVGLVKASKDKQVEIKLEKLREIEQRNPNTSQNDNDWNTFANAMQTELATARAEIKRYQEEIEKLNKQSKKLGNWRTGLLAGATATNVAGAIIAGVGQSTRDLETMVNDCRTATTNLRQSVLQAQIDGDDVSEAQEILSACGEYNYVDITKITKRGRGAMISSIVGASTGAAGTVTSAVANTDKIRDDDTDAGIKKEKALNTTANVLSGATTVASATATVFSATQISAIKKVASVAEKCTGVLK